MIDKPAVERLPGGYEARVGIKIAQPDRRLRRGIGQGTECCGVDIAVRRVHQHDVKRLEKRGVDRPRVGVVQQICDKRREHGVIDAHGRQDIGGEPGAGGIAHRRAADNLGLVPEGLKSTADLIHDCAAGLVVAAGHKLCLDKPLFPVEPGLLVGKLPDKRFQRLGTAARRHPVKPCGHQRICIRCRAGRRHRTVRDNIMRERRKRRRRAEHPVIVQQQGGAACRSVPPDGGVEAGVCLNSDIGDAEDRGTAFLQAGAGAGQAAVRGCRAGVARALLRDVEGNTLAGRCCCGARSSCAAAVTFSRSGCISSCFRDRGRLCRLACGRHFKHRELGHRLDRIINRCDRTG